MVRLTGPVAAAPVVVDPATIDQLLANLHRADRLLRPPPPPPLPCRPPDTSLQVPLLAAGIVSQSRAELLHTEDAHDDSLLRLMQHHFRGKSAERVGQLARSQYEEEQRMLASDIGNLITSKPLQRGRGSAGGGGGGGGFGDAGGGGADDARLSPTAALAAALAAPSMSYVAPPRQVRRPKVRRLDVVEGLETPQELQVRSNRYLFGSDTIAGRRVVDSSGGDGKGRRSRQGLSLHTRESLQSLQASGGGGGGGAYASPDRGGGGGGRRETRGAELGSESRASALESKLTPNKQSMSAPAL